jgi:hypothetical protein
MQSTAAGLPAEVIEHLIFTIRGQRVILDADLARLYGVATRRFNQAFQRNHDRFPVDFAFRLTGRELAGLKSSFATPRSPMADGYQAGMNRSQIAIGSALVTVTQGLRENRSQFVTGSQKHRDPRFLPWAFTGHGAIMAANVLNSPRAVQMSVYVIRAFVRMRTALGSSRELARKLAALEKELKARLDVHEAAIVDILQRVMDLFDPPALPEPKHREIGFHAPPPEAERAGERNG